MLRTLSVFGFIIETQNIYSINIKYQPPISYIYIIYTHKYASKIVITFKSN